MRKVFLAPALMVAVALVLSGCGSKSEKQAALDPFAGTGSPHFKGSGDVPWGGGREHIGKPYQVAGRWFTPKEQPNYDKKGPASWYGEAFHRRKTSNGEWFDMNRLTAAHPTLPLPSYVKVTNLNNGKEVIVRVNDRGPFVGPRIIDLSKRTAEVLDFKRQGKANVRVQYIGRAPVRDNGTHLAAMNKELARGTSLHRMVAAASRGGGGDHGGAVVVASAKTPKVKAPPRVQTVSYESQDNAVSAASGVERSYFVQVGSFAELANAERARDQFASAWPVQFMELSGSQGTVYRVRLGPISRQEDAEFALEGAIATGYDGARLVTAEAMQASLQ